MNWTEGRLARHSRARRGNKSTLLRQKEHFAKARAARFSRTAKPTPSFSSFFPPPPTIRAEQSSLVPAPLPLAKPLGGCLNRSSARKRHRPSSSSKQHEESVLPLPGHSHGNLHGEDQSRTPSASSTRMDDITFLERRKKLLRDYDWAGIRLQKPLAISFDNDTSGRKWSRYRGAEDFVLRDRHGTATWDDNSNIASHGNGGVKITLGSHQVQLGDPSGTSWRSHIAGSQQDATLGLKPYRGMPIRNTIVSSSASEFSRHRSTDYNRKAHGSFHAPTPLRRFLDFEVSLTRRTERDETDSVLAQVGSQTPPLSPERQAANETWRRLAALQSDTGSVNSERVQPHISPGMSARQQHAFPTTAAQGELSDCGDLSSSRRVSSYASRRLDEASSIPKSYFDDHWVRRKLVELQSQNQDIISRNPILSLPGRPTESASSQRESDHDWSSSAPDSLDQYLAGAHDQALKVLSRHLPRNNAHTEKRLDPGTAIGLDNSRNTGPDASRSGHISKDVPKARNTTGVTKARVSEKDPNDLWYSFVFSDANTEELHKEVLAEAQKDIKTGGRTARTDELGWGRTISNAATVGQPSVIGTSEMDDSLTSVPEACASHAAVQGSSKTTSSLTVEPPQSVVNPTGARENFRFAPPKSFVGRLADTRSDRRPTTNTAMMSLAMAKARRGRPRKKTRDGRLDIRSIPRYEDDPIEDFDELEVETRMQPSLFGSLETE